MTTGKHYILVINSGSSSLKFSLLDVKSEAVIASGIAERLGTAEALLKLSAKSSKNICEQLPSADHRAALRRVIDRLSSLAASEVEAIDHRIVHGGEYFRDAVLIDDEALNRIDALSDLAPLHNPPGAQRIPVASELFPNKPHVAVFDTAFIRRCRRFHRRGSRERARLCDQKRCNISRFFIPRSVKDGMNETGKTAMAALLKGWFGLLHHSNQ